MISVAFSVAFMMIILMSIVIIIIALVVLREPLNNLTCTRTHCTSENMADSKCGCDLPEASFTKVRDVGKHDKPLYVCTECHNLKNCIERLKRKNGVDISALSSLTGDNRKAFMMVIRQ